MTQNDLSDGARALFLDLWLDAGNWAGTPLFGGNVGFGKVAEGYLTKLKTAGLVTTLIERAERGRSGDLAYVRFTEAGEALAAKLTEAPVIDLDLVEKRATDATQATKKARLVVASIRNAWDRADANGAAQEIIDPLRAAFLLARTEMFAADRAEQDVREALWAAKNG